MKPNDTTYALPGVILRALLFSAMLVQAPLARTQYGFDHNTRNELGAFVGPGLLLHGTSLLVRPDPAPLWQRYSTFDRSQLPAFDRPAAFRWSLPAHRGSNIALVAGMGLSLGFCVFQQQPEDRWTPVLLAGESVLISSGLTDLVKQLVHRPRPYVFNPDVPDGLKQEGKAYVSFWSGHTANTAALTFTCASMLQRTDVDPGTRTVAWLGAALVPGVVGYLRVRSGRHFPTDVLTGYVVGALLGFAVPYFHHPDNIPFR